MSDASSASASSKVARSNIIRTVNVGLSGDGLASSLLRGVSSSLKPVNLKPKYAQLGARFGSVKRHSTRQIVAELE